MKNIFVKYILQGVMFCSVRVWCGSFGKTFLENLVHPFWDKSSLKLKYRHTMKTFFFNKILNWEIRAEKKSKTKYNKRKIVTYDICKYNKQVQHNLGSRKCSINKRKYLLFAGDRCHKYFSDNSFIFVTLLT